MLYCTTNLILVTNESVDSTTKSMSNVHQGNVNTNIVCVTAICNQSVFPKKISFPDLSASQVFLHLMFGEKFRSSDYSQKDKIIVLSKTGPSRNQFSIRYNLAIQFSAR